MEILMSELEWSPGHWPTILILAQSAVADRVEIPDELRQVIYIREIREIDELGDIVAVHYCRDGYPPISVITDIFPD